MEVNIYAKETCEINDNAMEKWLGCYKKKGGKCEKGGDFVLCHQEKDIEDTDTQENIHREIHNF